MFSLADRRVDHARRAPSSSPISTASRHLLTPERAVDIQARLGSDIAMVLDECLAYPATHEAAARVDAAVGPLGAPLPRRGCDELPRRSLSTASP